jgi:hypothetical protein
MISGGDPSAGVSVRKKLHVVKKQQVADRATAGSARLD